MSFVPSFSRQRAKLAMDSKTWQDSGPRTFDLHAMTMLKDSWASSSRSTQIVQTGINL